MKFRVVSFVEKSKLDKETLLILVLLCAIVSCNQVSKTFGTTALIDRQAL